MKNSKRRILLMLFLFFIFNIIVGTFYQNKKSKNDFKKFNSSNLSGRILYMDKFSRGVHFALDDGSVKYTFYPLSYKQFGEITRFKSVVQEGDSIVKPPFSDTLLLIKRDRIYRFSFVKYE